MVDLRRAQLVAPVDDDHARADAREQQRVRRGRVAAADHGYCLVPIEHAVARGAIADAAADQRGFVFQPEGAVRRARRDDDRAAEDFLRSCARGLDRAVERNRVHLRGYRPGAEALRALAHLLAQRQAVDARVEAGIVVDLQSLRHLAACGQLFQHHGAQPGARGIQRGGISGGAAANYDHIMNLHVEPSLPFSLLLYAYPAAPLL